MRIKSKVRVVKVIRRWEFWLWKILILAFEVLCSSGISLIHTDFFFGEPMPSLRSHSHVLMYLERYQLPIARRSMYPTVGTRERGRMFKRYGSRIISTFTGGTLAMRVVFVV